MSGSNGQIIGTIVGGIVGAFIPGGYIALGASVGGMIGGAIDPLKGPKVEGPRLSDLSQQTASFGVALPRIYGACAVHGNVFWIENNALKEVSATTETGGKGGSSSEVTEYSYFATFGLALCEGEIAGIRRIWINGKLFYDAGSSDIGTIYASNAAAAGFTLYRGTADQQASPRMQATVGVANTPGYRNTAWILFEDLPLKEYGNTLVAAQIKVEVLSVATASVQRTVHTAPYFAAEDNEAFSPQPFYIGLDKISFAAPQWDNIYPETSTYILYDMFPDGTTVDLGSVVCPGTSCPPNQRSQSGIYLYAAAQVFSGNYFNSASGFISEAPRPEGGSLFAGITNYPTLTIHVSTGDPSSQITIAATAGDASIVTDGTYIYVSGSGSTRKYDRYLNLITTGIGISGQNLAVTKLAIDAQSGCLCLSTGGLGPSVYRFSLDLSSAALIAGPLVVEDVGYYTENFFIDGNLIIVASSSSAASSNDTLYGHYWNTAAIGYATVTLDDIVLAESLKSEVLAASDLNVASLTDTVTGYRVSSMASIRSGLEPLQASWPFDVAPSGYKIKFVRRGVNSSVATIDAVMLDARPAGSENGVMLRHSREMDLQLPWRVEINHIDFGRDYDVGTQYAERLNTDSVNEAKMELAIVMTADEAAQKSEILLHAYWLERSEFSFTLPPSYGYLEPADIITLTTATGTYVVRLTGLQYRTDGVIECTARFNDANGYTSIAVGANSAAALPSVIPYAGPVIYELLDVPLLKDSYNYPSCLVAMSSQNTMWDNGLIYRSLDSGQTWALTNAFASQSKIGFGKNAIGEPSSFLLLDKSNVLNAYVYAGTLSSVSELQLLAGANHFAYGRDGRWEIIASQSISLQSDDTYNLSDLMRGRFGTEWAASQHEVGDHLISLDETTVQLIGMNSSQIGIYYLYRGIPEGGDISAATETLFAYSGVNLKPLSPVYAKSYFDLSNSSRVISWVPRSRTPVEAFSGIPTPLGETSESYEVEIWSSGHATLKRTLTGLSSPTATYLKADQITDFGVEPETVPVKIYQLSPTVGRGYPLVTSLTTYVVQSDPHWADVGLLLHMDGTDGGTTFTDQTGKSISANNAVTKTDVFAFGTSSGYFAASGYGLTTASHSSLVFGTGNFTIEGFVRISANGNYYLFHKTDWYVMAYIGGDSVTKIRWNGEVGSAAQFLPVGAFVHVAVVRISGVVTLFVGGAVALSVADTTDYSGTGLLSVGSHNSIPSSSVLSGHMDEVRITKGFARYTAAFTPPSLPFPNA